MYFYNFHNHRPSHCCAKREGLGDLCRASRPVECPDIRSFHLTSNGDQEGVFELIKMDVDLAIKTAAERLGFKRLKEKQVEAIKAFISGKDVFVSLPTGCGKSLIYGILPLVFNILEGLSHSDLLYIK